MKKLKVGLIGFGLSGRTFHSPLLLADTGFEVAAVSSRRIDEVKSVFPQAQVFEEAEALIHMSGLDLVINTAPNDLHYSLTKMALEAGRHVVVEKPFVNSSAEGRELIALAKQKSVALTVFQNRRWDSDFLTIKKLISENRLGQIKQFESHFDRWRPEVRVERWREKSGAGTGILYDLGSHLIDQALNLFGEPDSLQADVVAQKTEAATDDYFHVVLNYGSMRVILHSTSFADSTPRFQVFGDHATFTKYGLDPQEAQMREGLSPRDLEFGREEPENFGIVIEPGAGEAEAIESSVGQYSEFYRLLREHIMSLRENPASAPAKPLPVEPSEALRVIELIELAHESSKSGRRISLK